MTTTAKKHPHVLKVAASVGLIFFFFFNVVRVRVYQKSLILAANLDLEKVNWILVLPPLDARDIL